MDWAMFGWREGILLLVGLAVLYLFVTLVRLMRVGRGAPAAQAQEIPYLAEPAVEPVAEPEPATPENIAPAATGFGEQLAEHLARSDMETEIRRLRKEMEAMRAELEELRAARHVSPHYADAMELSQRGLTAQDVADRLGISLGEAELVHALSRGDRNFDEGENDGADRNAGSDRFEPSVGFEHRRSG